MHSCCVHAWVDSMNLQQAKLQRKLARALEHVPAGVHAIPKNRSLSFSIPYTMVLQSIYTFFQIEDVVEQHFSGDATNAEIGFDGTNAALSRCGSIMRSLMYAELR